MDLNCRHHFYRSQGSWGKVMFLNVSVTGRGMCGGGHVFQGCVCGGGAMHVWWGACVVGGMHGGGHAWQGGHVWRGGMCGTHISR